MNRAALLTTFVVFAISIGGSHSWGRSPRVPVYTQDGRKYREDDCEKSAARHAGKCGVIFEKKECDDGLFKTGSEKAIEEGRWINLRGTGFHEDVESIIVAPGCVIFGYDENDRNDRGTGISVSAVGKRDWVYRELSSHRFVSYTLTIIRINHIFLAFARILEIYIYDFIIHKNTNI